MMEEDVKELVRKIAQMNYTERTKVDHYCVIKKFFRWLGSDDRRIRWLKVGMKRKDKKLPEELLKKENVQKLIKACIGIRDKAMVSVLWESGVRIGEFLGMKIKNVHFDEYGAAIIVGNRGGKTGARRIRLVCSVPHLPNWLEHHPRRGDPEAPLWVGIRSKNYGRQLMYHSIRAMLKKAARKAGIKKRVNPHLFRHSRATDLANHLTEAQMKEFFGWTMDSDMGSVYVHLSGRDTDEAILRMYGKLGEDEKREHEQPKTQPCQICGHENAPKADFCLKCRKPKSEGRTRTRGERKGVIEVDDS